MNPSQSDETLIGLPDDRVRADRASGAPDELARIHMVEPIVPKNRARLTFAEFALGADYDHILDSLPELHRLARPTAWTGIVYI
jgi:hypothetical protein